ncbi:hypothetical protein HEP86_18050 [Streptomyces sp. RPA4-5]|uniref:hypothetical protein n=1 Tax=unclassified Streptomyces TaxID=2593676 RepID=UPI00143EED7A|nr:MULTISPECIES: hypothetical protein [unclassified Streptomyces]QIY56068.1 hypothetical protein HEP86_18050 [Streptomyces sp. RPA4-5]WJY38925.1 hypothetical protein QT196_17435 [Streptomyces sp. P9-2B-2]
MTRTRVIPACFTVAAAGVLAAVARVLIRPAAALPRWDLLGCLALTVAGLVGALVCLRRGPVPRAAGAGSSRFWWPARNYGWSVAGLWAAAVPVGLFLYGALAYSPEAARITEADGGIRAVSVRTVLSAEYVRQKHSGHYEVVARVAVPFDAGTRSERAAFSSERRTERGDRVWALFAPSSAELGVLVDSDRDALRAKAGGSAPGGVLAVVLVAAGLALCLGTVFGGFSRASRGLRRPLKKGWCRAAPVTVRSVAVAEDSTKGYQGVVFCRLRPVLKLEGAGGEHLDVLLDPVIDPSHLSREINGLPARLYWEQRAAEHPGPLRARAMVVLEGQRCLRGDLTAGRASDRPEGTAVPTAASLPGGDRLRAIRTYPAWDPKLHAEGLWWVMSGVLALGVVAFGVGRWVSFALGVAAFCVLFMARLVMNDSRARYLKGFLPEPAPRGGR